MRFYHQYYFIENEDKAPNKNSQGGCHSFERTRCPTCGKQHLGRCLAKMDGYFACGNEGHNMRDFPNIRKRE